MVLTVAVVFGAAALTAGLWRFFFGTRQASRAERHGSVVASTFTRTSWAAGTATFAAYAFGMSAVLMTLTIALAFTQHSLVHRLRALSRHLNRISGAIFVLAGSYIVYYWTFNLSTDPGETTTPAGPARFVEAISADATTWVQNLGWATTLTATIAIITTAAALAARHHQPTAHSCASQPADKHTSEPTNAEPPVASR